MTAIETELRGEIARCRDIVLPEYIGLGVMKMFALPRLREALASAESALAQNDMPAMTRAHEALKKWK